MPRISGVLVSASHNGIPYVIDGGKVRRLFPKNSTRLQKARILLDLAKRDTLVESIGGEWYTVIERDKIL